MNTEPFNIAVDQRGLCTITAASDTDMLIFKRRLDRDGIENTLRRCTLKDQLGNEVNGYAIDSSEYFQKISASIILG